MKHLLVGHEPKPGPCCMKLLHCWHCDDGWQDGWHTCCGTMLHWAAVPGRLSTTGILMQYGRPFSRSQTILLILNLLVTVWFLSSLS